MHCVHSFFRKLKNTAYFQLMVPTAQEPEPVWRRFDRKMVLFVPHEWLLLPWPERNRFDSLVHTRLYSVPQDEICRPPTRLEVIAALWLVGLYYFGQPVLLIKADQFWLYGLKGLMEKFQIVAESKTTNYFDVVQLSISTTVPLASESQGEQNRNMYDERSLSLRVSDAGESEKKSQRLNGTAAYPKAAW